MENRRQHDFTMTPAQQRVRDFLADLKRKNVAHYEAHILRLYQEIQKAKL